MCSEDLASPTGVPATTNFSVGGEVLARSPVGSVADLSGQNGFLLLATVAAFVKVGQTNTDSFVDVQLCLIPS